MQIKPIITKAQDGLCAAINSVDTAALRDSARCAGAWLSKILHIRHRYLFTKENKLRLRYVASGFCLLAAAGLFSMSLSHNDYYMTVDSMATLSVAERDKVLDAYSLEETQRSLTDLLDSRLYGKFSLASATSHAIPQPKNEKVKIKAGDALGVVLQKKGVGGADTNKVIKALSKHYDPRKLKAGQEIAMHFKPTAKGDYRF